MGNDIVKKYWYLKFKKKIRFLTNYVCIFSPQEQSTRSSGDGRRPEDSSRQEPLIVWDNDCSYNSKVIYNNDNMFGAIRVRTTADDDDFFFTDERSIIYNILASNGRRTTRRGYHYTYTHAAQPHSVTIIRHTKYYFIITHARWRDTISTSSRPETSTPTIFVHATHKFGIEKNLHP